MSNDKLAKVETNEITTATDNPYAPTTFDAAWRLAKVVVASRLAPGLESPEAAFVVLATGHELGLSPMQSLRGIHNIKGRPCPSADTLVAVCLSSGKAEYFREVSNDASQSTWETKRHGMPVARYSFSMSDAKIAGLASNSMYAKYPKRMLAARAKAYLARDVYPDLVLGLYTPEEMPSVEPKPMQDWAEPEAEAEAEPEPEAKPWADTLPRLTVVESFERQINACKTTQDLDIVGLMIKKDVTDPADKEALKASWVARRNEIKGAK